MRKNTGIIIWIVAAALLLAAAYTFYSKYKSPLDVKKNGVQQESSADKIFAPDFTLKDINGNDIKLSDYKDKIVILNFWATWCPYCKKEMPDLNELNKQLEKDNDAVILTIDSKEPADIVKDYINTAKLDLKVLLDTDGAVTDKYARYGLEGFPTTFIINTDGSFYTYILGATDKDTLLKLLKKAQNGEPVNQSGT